MAELAKAIERLDEFWQARGLSEDQQADLNIAAEEIVSNVIRHSGTEAPISLEVALAGSQVRLDVRDEGAPFDPLAHAPADPNAPLDQRRAGGLGIYMVLKMMTEVRYARVEGRNCLTMIRKRSG